MIEAVKNENKTNDPVGTVEAEWNRESINRRTAHLKFKAALLRVSLALAGPVAPQNGNGSPEPLTFVVIGDTGSGNAGQFEIARQMKLYYRDQVRYGFVLMLGDNVYPDGNPALLKSRFEEPYQDLLKAGVKFYAVLGTHDLRKGAEAQPRYENFNMGGRRYYSFTKGDGLIEFFALDSDVMNEQQLPWLETALKSSQARWKVAFFHDPIYSSARKHGSNTNLRAKLEPLFTRYRVDAVFAGHDHVYERVKPQQGVYYFVEGASGQLRKGDLNRKSTILETGNDEVNSFLTVQVGQEQMKIEARSASGALLDAVSIGKSKQ